MINKMSVLRRELRTAVGGLRNGVQSYKIIWYSNGPTAITERGPGKDGLIVCTQPHKDATFIWMDDVVSTGTTDPIPAIRAAFALKPDLIYCHTRGHERGPRERLPGNDQTGACLAGVTLSSTCGPAPS